MVALEVLGARRLEHRLGPLRAACIYGRPVHRNSVTSRPSLKRRPTHAELC
jgi:hypothetical protein